MRFLLLTSLLIAPLTATADSAVRTTRRSAQSSGVVLDLHIDGRRGTLSDAAIRRWVQSRIRLSADYCGRFPVPTLRVEVALRSGSRVGFGQHFAGRRVRVHVGRNTTEDTLAREHVLLHELLHTALPSLDRRHRWMREGLSTYLESTVLAQAGVLSEEDLWARWTSSMPNGLPNSTDRGLDQTPTWGRTYWGGALFWMVVDVELRRATSGRHTLRSLVRGIVAGGGVARRRWPMRRLLRLADSVTGSRVVSRAYRRMALRPRAPNLDTFFARLGVYTSGDAVELRPNRLRRSMLER